MLEFRLTYKGGLRPENASSGSGNVRQKHAIRQEFHRQLAELWEQHPGLRRQREEYFLRCPPPNFASSSRPNSEEVILAHKDARGAKTWVEHVADEYSRCGYRFVPLIRKEGGLTCALDVLFLRRDNPGNLVKHGGDIDNRIKTLLDALTMPQTLSNVDGPPRDGEDPFFCLLEDDSLITSVSVTTDRLLTPMEEGERLHDVHLVIRVQVFDPSALFAGNRLI